MNHNKKITGIIDKLDSNQVFVFGSNEAGTHGKGAALQALKFGAIRGVAEGIQGDTYAIPTRNKKIKTLSISKIEKYVQNFIKYASENSDLTFMVTSIGCGYAGYNPKDMAPLFKDSINLDNVYLPQEFWNILQ